MVAKSDKTNSHQESLLAKFHLDYELDKSWQEAKKEVKIRTER